MLISLCLETDEKYSDKQIIIDIPEAWLIPEKNHSARNIYPTTFSIDYWFDKIDVSDNLLTWVSISSKWLEIWALRKGHKGSLLFYCALASVRITGLPDMAIYLQLIIKITQSDSSGFQSKG